MFAPLVQLFRRRPDPESVDIAFVRDVRVTRPRVARRRRTELVLGLGWVCVIAKSFAVDALCEAYAIPFAPFWLIGPTVAFAALCTWVYVRRP
jgi:hypothetical protein